ncbi:MAG: Rieske (2Fe-2S) protein [Myxococcota bacterium]
MAFERVARLVDIPRGSGLRVCALGRAIGLYRLGSSVVALQDECPHQGRALSRGKLVGSRIVCPGHGWEFDVRTGLAPGEVDEPPLTRYAVRVDGEWVWLDPVSRDPPSRDASGGGEAG